MSFFICLLLFLGFLSKARRLMFRFKKFQLKDLALPAGARTACECACSTRSFSAFASSPPGSPATSANTAGLQCPLSPADQGALGKAHAPTQCAASGRR